MSESKVFYKLKYSDWLQDNQIEELLSTELGVAATVGTILSLIDHYYDKSIFTKAELQERITRNPILESKEFFEDIRDSDLKDIKQNFLLTLVHYLSIYNEMENE